MRIWPLNKADRARQQLVWRALCRASWLQGKKTAVPETAPQTLTVVAKSSGRTCGDCAACCKTHGVLEIAKPQGVWCTHCHGHRSCAVYSTPTFPRECADFRCAWLDGAGDEEDRPDRLRVVETREQVRLRGYRLIWHTLLEVTAGALSKPAGQARVSVLGRAGGVVETIAMGGKRLILVPPGVLPPDIPHLEQQLRRVL